MVASVDHDHSANSATVIGTIRAKPNAAIRRIRSTTVIPTSVVDHRATLIGAERQLVIERVGTCGAIGDNEELGGPPRRGNA